MQLRGAVTVLVTAFTIGGAGVRAEQPLATAPLGARPLRFTLDSQKPAPGAQAGLPNLEIARRVGEARARLAATVAEAAAGAAHGQEWNCGMPVVRPPANVDPRFERRPDDRLAVAIRRAAPPACGR